MDTSLSLTLAALAVWRLTHLLHAELGPGAVLERLRAAAGGGVGQALGCFYCLSLWIAAPFAGALLHGWPDRLLGWLALSGAAILLERIGAPRAVVVEDPQP